MKPIIHKKQIRWSNTNWEIINIKAVEFRDQFLEGCIERSVTEVFKSFISAICEDLVSSNYPPLASPYNGSLLVSNVFSTKSKD